MELKDDSTQPRKKQKLVQHDPRDSLAKLVSAARGEVKEIDLLFPSTTNQEDLYRQLFQSEQLVRVKCRENQIKDLLVSGVNLRSEEEDAWTCTWDEQDSLLDAWILPQGIEWPSLQSDQDNKQDNALGRRVLFQRTAIHCEGRDNYTIKALREGKKVAWVGLPGIGKSASLSSLLLIFIQKLGEEGWPKNIYLRLGTDVILFTWSEENDGEVEVKEMYYDTLIDFQNNVNRECKSVTKRGKQKTDYVVLLELKESENDPEIIFPHFVTASSRNAKKVLKTFGKSGGRFLLSDPPSWPELLIMRELLSLEEFGGSTSGEEQGRVLSAEYFLEAYKNVGPIPRVLLSSDAKNKVDMVETERRSALSNFFKINDDIDIFNIPPGLKFFAAPFVRKGVRLPVHGAVCVLNGSSYEDCDRTTAGYIDNYSYRFLSSTAANMVSTILKVPQELEALKKYGLEYQVLEQEVLHLLFLKRDPDYKSNLPVHSFLSLDRWQFKKVDIVKENSQTEKKGYEDSEKLKKKLLDNVKDNVKLKTFDQNYLKKSVESLDSTVVYRSTKINFPFCDMLAVNHETKRVTMVNPTSKSTQQHPFNSSSVIKVLEDLGMFEGPGLEYKVNFVFATTSNEPDTSSDNIVILQVKDKINKHEKLVKGVSDEQYDKLMERFDLVVVMRKS